MTTQRPHQVVEVIQPRSAPHLAPIVAEIEHRMLKHLEALPTHALRRLLRAGAAIEQEREAFRCFMARLKGA
jgi:hypothetical protein